MIHIYVQIEFKTYLDRENQRRTDRERAKIEKVIEIERCKDRIGGLNVKY